MSLSTGRTLALIPAKEGSTRLPSKNILPLAGISLLERTIAVARKSGLFDRISVSTESERVAEIARGAGIEVPILRPSVLARDPAGVVDVALHELAEWRARGESYDTLVILLPTSPFRTSQDLIGAMDAYLQQGVDFLMSVVREVHSPLSSLVRREGQLLPLHPEWLHQTGAKSTTQAPDLVRANGAVTIVNVARFEQVRDYYGYPLGSFEMPEGRSLDIDTPEEFAYAEFIANLHPEWLDA